jgi:Mn-dependent DtxR family transcriptional regulator
MDTKSNQRNRIIQYIRENGSATVRELFIYLNINSPTKRLSELRKLGLIRDEEERKLRQDGTVVRFKRYYLEESAI